jgi:hypothetical protein
MLLKDDDISLKAATVQLLNISGRTNGHIGSQQLLVLSRDADAVIATKAIVKDSFRDMVANRQNQTIVLWLEILILAETQMTLLDLTVQHN